MKLLNPGKSISSGMIKIRIMNMDLFTRLIPTGYCIDGHKLVFILDWIT